MNPLEARAMEITGHTSDLNEALDDFERTKESVTELFDDNQALSILNRKLRLTLDLAFTVIALTEKDAGMFITEKTRKRIAEFRDQFNKLDNAKFQSQLITEKEKPHVQTS